MQSLINVVATASGGYGRNAQGGAFSRQNQMGTDHLNHLNPGGVYDGDDGREGTRPATALQDIGKRTRLKSSFDSRELFHYVNDLLGPYLLTMG